MKKQACFLLGIAMAFLLPACGGPKIISAPAKRTVQTPASRPAAIPPTQRPYRIAGKTYHPLPSCEGYEETGLASWYGKDFHGRKTSNGETYDMYGMTAAHKILPMNTFVRVKNLENGREIVVRVNDRGPFVKGRIIDLTHSAARELNMIDNGTARVQVTALGETVALQQDGRKIERFLPHRDFSRGEFAVQVGSFVEQENAFRLQHQINAWGQRAVVRPHEQDGRRFYRVQVAAGRELSEARHLERVLSEGGFPDAFVIAR